MTFDVKDGLWNLQMNKGKLTPRWLPLGCPESVRLDMRTYVRMGTAGNASELQQAWQRALRGGKPDEILMRLRDLHTYGEAKISDDTDATIALAEAGDPRWKLAAGQLLATLTQRLRLDLDGADEALGLLEGLPDTGRQVRELSRGASSRTGS